MSIDYLFARAEKKENGEKMGFDYLDKDYLIKPLNQVKNFYEIAQNKIYNEDLNELLSLIDLVTYMNHEDNLDLKERREK